MKALDSAYAFIESRTKHSERHCLYAWLSTDEMRTLCRSLHEREPIIVGPVTSMRVLGRRILLVDVPPSDQVPTA